jgi:hypothetical protein
MNHALFEQSLKMKIATLALLILAFSILSAESAWTDPVSERLEKSGGVMSLIPGDDEVPGWKRSEKLLRASNEEELYRIFNGGASLYIQHGFQSFVGQSYKGPKGLELEVYIFDQRTPQNAEDLYENPFTKPSRIKEIANLGRKARIDMTPLSGDGVDFVLKGFVVRVIIQDKTDDALNSAMAFARLISRRIMTSSRAGGLKIREPLKADGKRAPPNSEFGMWNSEFFVSFFPFRIPHFTFRIYTARLILRKTVEASRKRARPADAF